MTVFVANQHIKDPGALSDLGRLALSFIDGGMEWLAWAGSNAAAIYNFADESSFVAAVQQGLHASPLALLPRLGLVVSPAKLMALSPAELRSLARAEGGDDNAAIGVQLKQILAAHGLLSCADLAAGVKFLGQVGVADAPLFQTLEFADRLALYDLLQLSAGQNAQNPDLQKEAAAFGVRQAHTPAEFIDYYKCYLHQAAKLDALDGTAEQRGALADQALKTLLPLLFGALDCPRLPAPAGHGEVAQAVGSWLASGKQIGFARLSHGVQQMIQNTRFRSETGEAARALVDGYLGGTRALLSANRPARGEISQDGASQRFVYQSAQQEAEVVHGNDGTVTLQHFRDKPGPTPAPAPAPAAGASGDQETPNEQPLQA